MSEPTPMRLRRALLAYHINLLEVRRMVSALRTAGLETYREEELDRWQKKVEKTIEQLTKKNLTDADYDAISNDIDKQRLGHISWEDAVERSHGSVVKAFDQSETLLQRFLDMVQV